MDLSLAASPSSFDLLLLNSHKFSLFQFNRDFSLKSKKPPTKSLFWRQNRPFRVRALNDDGFILEDVPHLTDFLPHLPVINHSVFPSLKLPFLFSILGFFFFFFAVVSKSFTSQPCLRDCQVHEFIIFFF
jgi:hypothetical protein